MLKLIKLFLLLLPHMIKKKSIMSEKVFFIFLLQWNIKGNILNDLILIGKKQENSI